MHGALIAVKKSPLHLLKRPKALAKGLRFIGVHVWRMKWDLLQSGFKMNKLTFVIHNFMHADCLVQERIDNCSFMTMTSEGPISMCMHNANRDSYITRKFKVKLNGEEKEFDPVRAQAKAKWEKLQAERAEIAAGSDHRYASVELAASK
jgi:hypothetical protein